MDQVKEITKCEVCDNETLVEGINLGMHPLCDDLIPIGSPEISKEYPIHILFCEKCYTAHQKYQVPKQKLFTPEYHYRARFTKDVLEGMKQLVENPWEVLDESIVAGSIGNFCQFLRRSSLRP